MAPRGRPRKVGLQRMDAAIDALTPMGFSPALIRKKVKELLKMYGGDEGWVFIEEAAYKVLIEYILEDQEQGESSIRDSLNEAAGGGRGGEEAEPSGAGLLIEASEPVCSNQEAALENPTTDGPLANHLIDFNRAVPEPSFSPAEHANNQGEVATSDEANQTIDIALIQEKIAALSETYMLSAPPGFEKYPRSHGYASTKRKPCLGWVGPKDDSDFVLLEPAPVLGWKNRHLPRKRKSRWDVGPDD